MKFYQIETINLIFRELPSSTASILVVTGPGLGRSAPCCCLAVCSTQIRPTDWWWSNSSGRRPAARRAKTAQSAWWTRPSWTHSAAIRLWPILIELNEACRRQTERATLGFDYTRTQKRETLEWVHLTGGAAPSHTQTEGKSERAIGIYVRLLIVLNQSER